MTPFQFNRAFRNRDCPRSEKLHKRWGRLSRGCFRSHQPFQFAAVEVEFGRSSVDTILAGQFGGRRPQLVGYRTLSLPVLSPLLEAGTYLVYCESPALAAHCHSSSPVLPAEERRYQLCPADFMQPCGKLTTNQEPAGQFRYCWRDLPGGCAWDKNIRMKGRRSSSRGSCWERSCWSR